MKRAVVLFSGGLDSTTLLYYARNKGYKVQCLIFDYGQRHRKEIKKAIEMAQHLKCPYHVIKFSLPWKGSSLIGKESPIPAHKTINSTKIPSTYVPARNIIFLSFAASFAEAIQSRVIFIGANAIDYSGYPDCRPNFMEAYQTALEQGLKTGVKGKAIKIKTPLINKTKAQIIKMGMKMKVPYHLTWSCYAGNKRPCGKCDSCVLRQKGFESAGVEDPLV